MTSAHTVASVSRRRLVCKQFGSCSTRAAACRMQAACVAVLPPQHALSLPQSSCAPEAGPSHSFLPLMLGPWHYLIFPVFAAADPIQLVTVAGAPARTYRVEARLANKWGTVCRWGAGGTRCMRGRLRDLLGQGT